MSTREQRITAAQQTLNIFQQGNYAVENKVVDVSIMHQHSMTSTILYTLEKLGNMRDYTTKENSKTIYRLVDLPVVTALSMLEKEGKENIGILNFASAKNAGGGFLNGAQAQEESLAMCSNLYLTQIQNSTYYDSNRSCSSMLYTDLMIYSRDVVFIREDVGTLWNQPIIASVLTAPAVNLGVYLSRTNSDLDYANEVMKNRMRKILKVFIEQKNHTLVLGAYGCGVFRNDPNTIAKFFGQLLKEEGLETYFEEVVFAVFDSSKSKKVYTEFSEGLQKYLLI